MKRFNNRLKLFFIIIVLLCIGIGFAVLSVNLDINGLFMFSSNNWDIHFENAFVDPNSTVSDVPEIDSTKNSISFTATLSKPNDNYTFYVDVVNDSTVNAMFNSVEITGLDDVANYVTSTVTYDNGTSLNQNDILYKNFSSRLKVSIVYQDITKEQIPKDNITVDATMTFNYRQANSDAKLVAGTNQVNFDFSNKEDTYVVPYNGVYQLEVWGGQGQSNTFNNAIGGYGGYSVGNVVLTKESKIYVNVGGKGISGNVGVAFGGAGLGELGGGGATHISTKSGTLASLEDYGSDILIVAGGGGGNDTCVREYYSVPSGGGFQGNDGYNINDLYGTLGGGQSPNLSPKGNPGGFGYGGESPKRSNEKSDWAGGGGSGYYGGEGANSSGYCGAGGSGYIGNESLTNKVMYCYKCKTSVVASTKTETTDNVSDGAISKYAKIGNGYARISLVSIN